MMMIDGPRMPPARGGKPEALIVLLHGYGSNGEDLISLAPYWAKLLPGAQFVSPNAVEPMREYPGAYQWFPITQIDPHRLEAGVRAAAPALDRFIDRELERYGLDESRLALVGFSQGTMMALHVAPRRIDQIAGVVGYSGLLAGPEHLAADLQSTPPVLLIHGADDPLIPAVALNQAAGELGAAGIDVEWHIRPGLPHGIDQEGLELGGAFLRRVLGGAG